MRRAIRLVVFGRQGAGKGTQCIRLAEHFGVPHISTGEILRAAVEEGTGFGLKAKAYMDAGELLPDDVISGVVDERLRKDDTRQGFLLDGFPRTVAQAEALIDMVGEEGVDLAIDIDVPIPVVTQRMKLRGRDDDTDEAIRVRLETYEIETRPVLDFFDDLDKLAVVDGDGTEEEVFERIVDSIGRHAAA